MLSCIFVGIGGFIGAVCRYLLGFIPVSLNMDFPLITLLINFLGAFVIGIVSEFCCVSDKGNNNLTLMLNVGFCGGFTTFSTFSLEAFNLMASGKSIISICYIISSVVVCILGVFLGKYLIRCCFHTC